MKTMRLLSTRPIVALSRHLHRYHLGGMLLIRSKQKEVQISITTTQMSCLLNALQNRLNLSSVLLTYRKQLALSVGRLIPIPREQLVPTTNAVLPDLSNYAYVHLSSVPSLRLIDHRCHRIHHQPLRNTEGPQPSCTVEPDQASGRSYVMFSQRRLRLITAQLYHLRASLMKRAAPRSCWRAAMVHPSQRMWHVSSSLQITMQPPRLRSNHTEESRHVFILLPPQDVLSKCWMCCLPAPPLRYTWLTTMETCHCIWQ
mmetsp:Transcript_26119/g.52952  ORF Transcript_26119/g.52952 Transcript_26119/m.52952 type:complete len:257 (+) Transcript_26119:770-1540(+)